MPTIEGGLDFQMNLAVAMDGYPGHEHSLPIMPLFKDAVELYAKSGITYAPTLLVSHGGPWSENYFYEKYDIHDMPKVRRFVPRRDRQPRRAAALDFRENRVRLCRIAEGAKKIVEAGDAVDLGATARWTARATTGTLGDGGGRDEAA
ncbi:MAG: hypothetical protein U0133_06515 [Gemmatimonadales bacterium]